MTVFLRVSAHCNVNIRLLNLINSLFFFSAIVQCPIVLDRCGFDDSSIPLLMIHIGIYILPLCILNCFLHAVIYFVHCALSLIITVLYYNVHAVILAFLKMFVYSCCRSKSPTQLMLHAVQYSTQN